MAPCQTCCDWVKGLGPEPAAALENEALGSCHRGGMARPAGAEPEREGPKSPGAQFSRAPLGRPVPLRMWLMDLAPL